MYVHYKKCNERYFRRKNPYYTVYLATVDGYDPPAGTADFQATSGVNSFNGSVSIDNDACTIEAYYYPKYVVPEGEAEVTLNFVDRDDEKIKVGATLYYEYINRFDATDYAEVATAEDVDSWKMTKLSDGIYRVNVNTVDSTKAGYAADYDAVYFQIKDGKMVTEDVVEDGGIFVALAPYTTYGSIIGFDDSSIDYRILSYTVNINVTVPAFGDVAWKLKDSDSNEIHSSDLGGDIYLAPGKYTIEVVKDKDLEDYVVYPETPLSFKQDENYYISIDEPYFESTNVIDYGSTREILWKLEPKDTVAVKAKVSTIDGSNFDSGTQMRLVYENKNGELIIPYEEYLSAELSTYEKT